MLTVTRHGAELIRGQPVPGHHDAARGGDTAELATEGMANRDVDGGQLPGCTE